MDDLETQKIGKGLAGPGRPKGLPNKTTSLLKDAILRAAENAGNKLDGDDNGLVKYLEAQSIANPGPFMSLLGKVLPIQVAGDEDNPLRIIAKIELVPLTPKHDG